MQLRDLGLELAHVLSPGAGRGLIGHRGNPFPESGLEQAMHAHQHETHCASAPYEIPASLRQRCVNDVAIHRIEDDHDILLHAQSGRRVYPIAIPPSGAQLRMNIAGVIAPLAGDDDLHLLQFLEAVCILERGNILADGWARSADLRRAEEHRIDMVEIPLLLHALHQHRSDHAAPTYQSNSSHLNPQMSANSNQKTPSRLQTIHCSPFAVNASSM